MTHSWRLQAREFHIERHMCENCGCIRTKVTMLSAFPKVRYQVEGVVTEGRSPMCSQSAKPGEPKDV
jgi:hypothetical protein